MIVVYDVVVQIRDGASTQEPQIPWCKGEGNRNWRGGKY